MTDQDLPATTTVRIAGCSPAGAMPGLLLARAGIDVVVLEKHADFLRARRDTVHASTPGRRPQVRAARSGGPSSTWSPR